jgi:hypothetical protein
MSRVKLWPQHGHKIVSVDGDAIAVWLPSVMYYDWSAATGAVSKSLEHTHRNSFLTSARRASGSDLEI